MFRALPCSSSGGLIVCMQPLVSSLSAGDCPVHRLTGAQDRDPPSLLYNGYQVFPGGKEQPGRDPDPSPPFSAVVMKE